MRQRKRPPEWFRWSILAGWLGVALVAAGVAALSERT